MKRALVIVDHGSRVEAAHAHLEAIAERVRERAPDWIVRAAHMELARPGLDDAVEACVREGAEEVAVHPFFLSPGRHLTQDIPELVRAVAARHPGVRVRMTRAVGELPELIELILESAREP